MKTYKIPATWQVTADIEVRAESLSDAIEQVEKIKEPPKGTMIAHTLEVEADDAYEKYPE